MKTMSTKILSMVIVSLLLLSTFTGCSPGAEAPSAPASDADNSASDLKTEPEITNGPASMVNNSIFTKPTTDVSITFWYALSGESGEALLKLLDSYQAENPNIKIESSYSGTYSDTQTKVSANLAAGTAPDVVVMAGGPMYTGSRGDYTMEELIEDPVFNKDDIFEGIWEYSTYKGRKCSIPFGNSTPLMYYNKAIIEAAGIDLSTPPKTWDEFYDIALKAQKEGNINNSPAFYGFETNDPTWLFNSMLGQTGNELVTFEGDDVIPIYNDENAVKAAEFWQKLIAGGIMPVGEHDNAENVFLANNCAFFVASSSRIPRYSASEMDLGAIPMPAFNESKVALGGNMLVTFSKEPEKLAASWDIIKYLTNTQNHAQFSIESGYLPIRKSSIELDIMKKAMADNPMMAVSFGQLNSTWSYTWFDEQSIMYKTVTRAVERFEQGEDAKTALDGEANEFLGNIE